MSGDHRAAPPLVIRLFGSFDAQVNGCPLPRLRSRKGQWLLALLVLRQDKVVERSWLASALWPESMDSQAFANLRNALTDLRKSLGQEATRIQSPSSHTIRFDSEGADVDVIAFDTKINGNEEEKREAVLLYRRPLLEGCLEDWATTERVIREKSYLKALNCLATQAHQQNDPIVAIETLRQILAVDPYQESTLCDLMEAYAKKGDTASATLIYREFRLRFHQELQTDLHADTTNLYRRLIESARNATPANNSHSSNTASPKPRQSVLSSYPSPATPLFGREKEIADVSAALQTSRLVILEGPGGSGKTRLAIEVGGHLWKQFEAQVFFVSLAELLKATRLPEFVCDTIHLQSDQRNPFERLVNRLSSQPCLLILDNYEHLVEEGAEFVEKLLASAPSLTCLVTSRHSLHIPGEVEYRVQPLALPKRNENFPYLTNSPAIQLFTERATACRDDFKLTEANSEDIVALCNKLEGVPLAIVLVAAWANVLTPSQMLAHLEANFAFPRDQRGSLPERHGSLQKAFDGSYLLLDESERLLLSRLSVFTGGWTLEAAEEICGMDSDQNSEDAGEKRAVRKSYVLPTLVLLKRLIEKSLVLIQKRDESPTSQPRYTMLEMTRQYANERLSNAEREEIEMRHADYFLQTALNGEAEAFVNGTYRTLQAKMKPDTENYVSAYQKWKIIDSERALQMMLALNCWMEMLTTLERIELKRQLETQPLPPPSSLQAKLYLQVASSVIYHSPDGLLFERAYSLAEGCGDKIVMARILCVLGESDMIKGNLTRARERLEASRDYFVQSGHRAHTESVQQYLISLTFAEKRYEQARQMAEALLQSGCELNHWQTQARGLQSLAEIAFEQKEFSVSIGFFERAVALYPETESLSISNILRFMGRAAALQTDYTMARTYLFQALEVCQDTGDESHEAWCYHNLAKVAHQEGDDSEAIRWMKKALNIFDKLGENWSMNICLAGSARFFVKQPEMTAFFWIAYERFSPETGCYISPELREEIDAAYAFLQAALTEEAFTKIRKQVASMSLREVIRYADAIEVYE